jgi:hypothetical protein
MDKQQIESAIQELKEAMLENLEADQKVEEWKVAKIKAHKRLLLAKEAIRNYV